MEPYIYWVLAGLTLIIIEITSGTFYLLVIGLAAFAGAAIAWFGGDIWLQAVAATVLATAGVIIVHRRRPHAPSAGANDIDAGQRVTVESWVSEADGLARVRYRGTLWDARIVGDRSPGSAYVIQRIEGSTLIVEHKT